jgi:hypothetical protein
MIGQWQLCGYMGNVGMGAGKGGGGRRPETLEYLEEAQLFLSDLGMKLQIWKKQDHSSCQQICYLWRRNFQLLKLVSQIQQ